MVDDVDAVVCLDAAGQDGDGEVAELARRLRAELLDLDVESVRELTDGNVPDSTKGVSILVGALGVRLGAAALKGMLTKIRDWVVRNGRSVEVTIDGDTIKVTGVDVQVQDQLINAWLARHAAGS